jgi:putative membrane protein
MTTFSHEIRLFLIGTAMGVANIIPGVSGGTIAVVFGIYEDLMNALSHFLTDKQNRWKYIKFLTLVFSGSLLAIISLARVLSWAFENYPLPTVYFFMGLIIGSIPVVYRSHSDMRISLSRILGFIVGLLLVIVLALVQKGQETNASMAAVLNVSLPSLIYLVFAGAVAASAMIVPGVSGSFMLILLGVYWQVLGALSGLTRSLLAEGFSPIMIERIMVLGAIGIGVVIGILLFSKIMNWAIKHHPSLTMYMILGLIIGSIYQIYPGFQFSVRGSLAVVTFIIGFVISIKFGVEKTDGEQGNKA